MPVTVAVSLAVPPMPVQLTVRSFDPTVRELKVLVPLVANVVPPYEQDIASVLDQVSSTESSPTVKLAGDALTETVGSGAAISVAESLSEPPGPVQLTEKVYEPWVYGPTGVLPLVETVLPSREQDVASELLQDNVDVPVSAVIFGGFRLTVTVGGSGTTSCSTVKVADSLSVPAVPVQLTVNVRVPAE